MRRGLSVFNMTSLALGLAFLYLPIVILVIYSFNASRLVTVWGGWSTALVRGADRRPRHARRGGGLLRHRGGIRRSRDGARHLAALALTRLGRFRGRLAFSAMIYAPLVMPEVITGLSLLLMFVAADVDRGFLTDHRRAHHADHVLRHRGGAVAARRASTAASRRPRWISAARRCAPS